MTNALNRELGFSPGQVKSMMMNDPRLFLCGKRTKTSFIRVEHIWKSMENFLNVEIYRKTEYEFLSSRIKMPSSLF